MKKIFATALSLAAVFSIAGCSTESLSGILDSYKNIDLDVNEFIPDSFESSNVVTIENQSAIMSTLSDITKANMDNNNTETVYKLTTGAEEIQSYYDMFKTTFTTYLQFMTDLDKEVEYIEGTKTSTIIVKEVTNGHNMIITVIDGEFEQVFNMTFANIDGNDSFNTIYTMKNQVVGDYRNDWTMKIGFDNDELRFGANMATFDNSNDEVLTEVFIAREYTIDSADTSVNTMSEYINMTSSLQPDFSSIDYLLNAQGDEEHTTANYKIGVTPTGTTQAVYVEGAEVYKGTEDGPKLIFSKDKMDLDNNNTFDAERYAFTMEALEGWTTITDLTDRVGSNGEEKATYTIMNNTDAIFSNTDIDPNVTKGYIQLFNKESFVKNGDNEIRNKDILTIGSYIQYTEGVVEGMYDINSILGLTNKELTQAVDASTLESLITNGETIFETATFKGINISELTNQDILSYMTPTTNGTSGTNPDGTVAE